MQVYIELALLENFCMDFTLLYCAKIVCGNPAKIFRVSVAAALGACFAVAFPLFGVGGAWAAVIKIVSGAGICLICGKFKNFKAYFKLTAAFTVFTFLLGGALIGVFSLAGLDYSAGQGYVLSSVPVGIPLFFALWLVIAARKIYARLKKTAKTAVSVRVWLNGKCAELTGFFDSGNKVKFSGEPVSVIPLAAAMKIIDESGIKDSVKIHTVAGSRKLKVFTADKIEIDYGGRTGIVKNVKIGISPHALGEAVLHPDLSED